MKYIDRVILYIMLVAVIVLSYRVHHQENRQYICKKIMIDDGINVVHYPAPSIDHAYTNSSGGGIIITDKHKEVSCDEIKLYFTGLDYSEPSAFCVVKNKKEITIAE